MPRRKVKRIEQLYAFLVTDHGAEGVANCGIADAVVLPMIGGDATLLPTMRAVAELLATRTGYPVQFVQFTQRVDLETIEPVKEAKS